MSVAASFDLDLLLGVLKDHTTAVQKLVAILDAPEKSIGAPRSLAWRLQRFLSLAQANYSSSVVVGTSITPIAGKNPFRVELIIYNNGSATVYVGSAQVTATAGSGQAGIPIAPSTGMAFDRTAGEFWAVTASGTADVRILEQSATELAHESSPIKGQ